MAKMSLLQAQLCPAPASRCRCSVQQAHTACVRSQRAARFCVFSRGSSSGRFKSLQPGPSATSNTTSSTTTTEGEAGPSAARNAVITADHLVALADWRGKSRRLSRQMTLWLSKNICCPQLSSHTCMEPDVEHWKTLPKTWLKLQKRVHTCDCWSNRRLTLFWFSCSGPRACTWS